MADRNLSPLRLAARYGQPRSDRSVMDGPSLGSLLNEILGEAATSTVQSLKQDGPLALLPYENAPTLLEELMNSGYDNVLIDDGMSKYPSTVVLDKSIIQKKAQGGSVQAPTEVRWPF